MERFRSTKPVDQAFDSGVMVFLTTRCWGGQTALDKEMFQDALDKDIVKAVQALLHGNGRTLLKHLHDMRAEAKNYVDIWSFGANELPGIRFVPKESIEMIEEGLKRRQRDFFDAVDRFIGEFSAAKEEYARLKPDYYREDKYPSEDDLRSRFVFKWRFRTIGVPNIESGILTADMYRREREALVKDMQNIRDTAIRAIGAEFLTRIDSLRKQCIGGNINTATVDGLKGFIDKFESYWSNFAYHEQLKSMAEEVKEYLDGVGAEEIRADDEFRNMVKDKMSGIVDAFANSTDSRLRRRLDI